MNRIHLRGQDSLAESAIQMYRLLAEAHGCRVAEPLAEEIGNFKLCQERGGYPVGLQSAEKRDHRMTWSPDAAKFENREKQC